MKPLGIIGVLGCLLALPACVGALQTMQTATDLYRSGEAISEGYYSYRMTQSFRDAKPLFSHYSEVRLQFLIHPRSEDGQGLIRAFEENFRYIVRRNMEFSQLDLRVCDESCGKKVIVLQFKESGYDANLAQRVFVGSELRGTLYYIDRENDTVLQEVSLEVAADYEDLLRRIHASVAGTGVRTLYGEGRDDAAEQYGVRLESFDPILPKYASLFDQG